MAGKRGSGEGDEAFFAELLNQFKDEPGSEGDGGDEELAAFLDGLDKGSKEKEEAEVRSLLEDLPSLKVEGPLSAQPGVGRLLGGEPAEEDAGADAILAAFAEPGPEVAEAPGASEIPASPSLASGEPAHEAPPPPPPQTPELPPRTKPAPARSQPDERPAPAPARPAPRPPAAAAPRHRGAQAADPAAPVNLTLKDLFGLDSDAELTDDGPESPPVVFDALAPRKAFAAKRLHRFFLDYVQGRLKLSVLRYLLLTGLDRLTAGELEEVVLIPVEELRAPLGELVHSGLLVEDQGRYSLNPRSRNVLTMATLVTAWQDPEQREEIWRWIAEAEGPR